mmetsp:Transcript_17029/g.32600  ORF Transcript_17029/g.32600 Transcript_17029/m.32600 type:complete len:233 (+) Transcript_17029:694-1392(+)
MLSDLGRATLACEVRRGPVPHQFMRFAMSYRRKLLQILIDPTIITNLNLWAASTVELGAVVRKVQPLLLKPVERWMSPEESPEAACASFLRAKHKERGLQLLQFAASRSRSYSLVNLFDICRPAPHQFILPSSHLHKALAFTECIVLFRNCRHFRLNCINIHLYNWSMRILCCALVLYISCAPLLCPYRLNELGTLLFQVQQHKPLSSVHHPDIDGALHHKSPTPLLCAARL